MRPDAGSAARASDQMRRIKEGGEGVVVVGRTASTLTTCSGEVTVEQAGVDATSSGADGTASASATVDWPPQQPGSRARTAVDGTQHSCPALLARGCGAQGQVAGSVAARVKASTAAIVRERPFILS